MFTPSQLGTSSFFVVCSSAYCEKRERLMTEYETAPVAGFYLRHGPPPRLWTRVGRPRRWDQTVASRSQSCPKIIKLLKTNIVHTGERRPGGENKSIHAADESNPSSSERSRGSARRASTPATHYRSIPPKSRHILAELAPSRGSASGLPVPGTVEASDATAANVQIQVRRESEKRDIATVSFSVAPNFRLNVQFRG